MNTSALLGPGRRIVLVDFMWTRDGDPRIPLGHASLLAALRRDAALDVRSLTVAVNEAGLQLEQIAPQILTLTAGLPAAAVDVALGAYVWGEVVLGGLLPMLRRRGFAGRIVLGGPQISYAGAHLEQLYPDADAFIRGYGEDALSAFAGSSVRQDIDGLHWAGTTDRMKQAVVNLDALPSPWLTGLMPVEGQRFIRWETQRGCPFRCAFCQHREAGSRLTHRSLGLPRVMQEIDLFCASGVEKIAVLDPIFNMAPHAVGVLDRFSAHGFTGHLSLQCRAEAMEPAFLDAAARLDTQLEFGLQTIHSREYMAIKRPNHMARVDSALAESRRRGIHHEVSLIFGLPEQTLSSFEDSVAWCLQRRVPVIKAFPLLLLRGTALERDRRTWQLVDNGGAMPMVIQSASFSLADWEAMAKLSEALQATEGCHPTDIRELREIANTLEPDLLRWVPATLGRTA